MTAFTASWSPEDDEKLFSLRAQGMSCNQIAALIGRTKNSVISRIRRVKVDERLGRTRPRAAVQPKVHRVPLHVVRSSEREETLRRQRETRQEAAQARLARRLEVLGLPPDTDLYSLACGLYVQPRQHPVEALAPAPTCQWIEGDPSAGHVCGKRSTPGRSYCAEHAARCYVKASERDEAA